MSFLVLIILGAAFMAWKKRKPLKLVLSEDEARFCKERWWREARAEFKMWMVLFFFSAAVLSMFRCEAMVYLAVGLFELILVSRLVLLVMLLAAVIGWIIGSAAAAIGHPIYSAEMITVMFMMCFMAIAVRFFLFLLVNGHRLQA